MKAHTNATALVKWLRDHQPATVAQIAATGMMNTRQATDAVQYGIRHGVFESIKRPGASLADRVQIRLTGRPLPAEKKQPAAFSFDLLQTAWGITTTPPQLPATTLLRRELQD